MSNLIVHLRRGDDGAVTLLVSVGRDTSMVPLDETRQWLFADVLRHVDRMAFGQNPGPCERFLTGPDLNEAA